jgi:hypothetical protein
MSLPSRPEPETPTLAHFRRALGGPRVLAGLFVLAGCGSDPVRNNGGDAPPDCEATPEQCEPPPNESDYVTVRVYADRPTFVKLDGPSVVEVDDPSRSSAWDLWFEGYEVYTNGGISGPGIGSAFGPLPASYFAFPDEPVSTPFLIEDSAQGAFLRWYAYDGSNHTIYSRYHVYGVRSQGALYKLQLMSYYGEVAGAPVSARYRLRYAAIGAGGVEPSREIADIDGTAGGGENPDSPSGCVSLASGESSLLTRAEASQSSAWDICFRRDSVSVNGERGGPGEVSAVDLYPDTNEPVTDVKALTDAAIDARFEEVSETALTAPGLEYRGDYATSAFSRKWVDRESDPPAPVTTSAWLVVAADGVSRYLVGFDSFEDATPDAPGTLKLYVHPSP